MTFYEKLIEFRSNSIHLSSEKQNLLIKSTPTYLLGDFEMNQVAHMLYDEYIKRHAANEVDLSEDVKNNVKENLGKVKPTIFDYIILELRERITKRFSTSYFLSSHSKRAKSLLQWFNAYEEYTTDVKIAIQEKLEINLDDNRNNRDEEVSNSVIEQTSMSKHESEQSDGELYKPLSKENTSSAKNESEIGEEYIKPAKKDASIPVKSDGDESNSSVNKTRNMLKPLSFNVISEEETTGRLSNLKTAKENTTNMSSPEEVTFRTEVGSNMAQYNATPSIEYSNTANDDSKYKLMSFDTLVKQKRDSKPNTNSESKNYRSSMSTLSGEIKIRGETALLKEDSQLKDEIKQSLDTSADILNKKDTSSRQDSEHLNVQEDLIKNNSGSKLLTDEATTASDQPNAEVKSDISEDYEF